MTLQKIMRDELVRHLVGRNVTCLRTGEVLDARTCVVLLDRDGDPVMVLSQRGWAEVIAADPEAPAKLAENGWTVDPDTVKG